MSIAGIHAVKHALESGQPIDELLIEKGKKHPRINELIHLARKAKPHISFVPNTTLDRLSESVPYQGWWLGQGRGNYALGAGSPHWI